MRRDADESMNPSSGWRQPEIPPQPPGVLWIKDVHGAVGPANEWVRIRMSTLRAARLAARSLSETQPCYATHDEEALRRELGTSTFML